MSHSISRCPLPQPFFQGERDAIEKILLILNILLILYYFRSSPQALSGGEKEKLCCVRNSGLNYSNETRNAAAAARGEKISASNSRAPSSEK